MNHSGRCLSSLACGIATFAIGAEAQPYVEISAELTVAASSKSFPDSKPRIITVTCVTGPDTWRIENDYIIGAKSQLWFYDGTNVYCQLETTINVWPSRDGHPLGNVSDNIPWLAFCSGPYLKQEGRLIPLPAADLRHTRDRYAFTDKTTTFTDELGLPRTIDLFASRSLLEKSEDDFDREYSFGDRWAESKKRALAGIEEGKRTFHYEVTESTNFLGRTYPTQFRFSQSGRPYEQNGDWTWTGFGKVKSLRSVEKPAGLLLADQRNTIVDYRFPGAMLYQNTNTPLSPTNDSVLQQGYAKQREKLDRMRKSEAASQPKP